MPESALYSIDTNVLMDWQARYYPADIFGSLVGRIDALIDAGRWRAPALVAEEVGAVGTDALKAWAKARKALFLPTAATLAGGLVIQGQFPGLRDAKAEFDEADAYVIALARQTGGIVITQETPAAEKNRPKRSHYIPDVCRDLGIPCINLLGFFRREGWEL